MTIHIEVSNERYIGKERILYLVLVTSEDDRNMDGNVQCLYSHLSPCIDRNAAAASRWYLQT
jgi:hypothetical protein